MYISASELESHPHYWLYNIQSKNCLIRKILSQIESEKKRQKNTQNQINELCIKNVELELEIDELKECINIQREEINKLIDGKIVKPSTGIRKTYLMKDNHNGLYKIGFSNNIKNRETTLQSEKASIQMVKTWDKNIEKHLHKLYDNNRVRGEWFDLTKIQVKYICTHF